MGYKYDGQGSIPISEVDLTLYFKDKKLFSQGQRQME
jgi:hypothetical protein